MFAWFLDICVLLHVSEYYVRFCDQTCQSTIGDLLSFKPKQCSKNETGKE